VVKRLLLSALLLGSGLAHAEQASHNTDEGFTQPLQGLTFVAGPDTFVSASSAAMQVYDPLERWNRSIYQFNYRLDQWLMLPAVQGYVYVTPKPLRTGVSNVFSNLGDVTSLGNSLLQLKGQRAMRTTARLLFNTLLGVGGLWDPATAMGLPKEREDFGQTLGHYGVASGAYLVLPVFGPSSLRDSTGLLADTVAASNLNYLDVAESSRQHPQIKVLEAIDTRYVTPFKYGQLNTPFEYSRVRYLYGEMRRLQVSE